MSIVPDTKDWTWVLERPCPECGFDSAALPREEVASLLRDNAERWVAILAGPPSVLRRRPRPDRWSALEYACHVRDVFRLFETRLELMLTLDDPAFPNWDQDRTAEDDRYDEQDPAVVATELAEAAQVLAASFDSVGGALWERRGVRSDGARFTVESFGHYLAHDPVHHLHDVTVDLAAPRA